MVSTIPAPLSALPLRSISPKNSRIREVEMCRYTNHLLRCRRLALNCGISRGIFAIRAGDSDSIDSNKSGNEEFGVRVSVKKNEFRLLERKLGSFGEMLHVLSPSIILDRRNLTSNYAIATYILLAIFVIMSRQIIPKKQSHNNQGSIADLVRRGHLKSNRRGIAKTNMYDDPFNNPLVKIDRDGSTVQMFGKVYRLAPVTLTKEQQLEHQMRRSRAYQWKRPKVFLKEGDPIPPDVDPDSVRWIPHNHPFASTTSDIDEETVKSSLFQKDGVPFRVRAEHEALKKKLEALESEPRFQELAVNLKKIEDLEGSTESVSKPDDDKMYKDFGSSDENRNSM